MRYLTAGESHGPALIAVIEGLPANLILDSEAINHQLWRRQQGYGRGYRMKIESDQVEFLTGLRFNHTLGTPLTMKIENKDYKNWISRMSPTGDSPDDLNIITKPRPGHADLPAALKYDFTDIRNTLERASARNTTTLVAIGAVARQLLKIFDIHVYGHIVQIGEVKADPQKLASLTIEELASLAENSPVRCADEDAATAMMSAIDQAKQNGDTLGGIFEVMVTGVPIGLGSYALPENRLDGKIASGLMSIQAIKGVEIGLGFEAATKPGSQVHDALFYSHDKGYYRNTNGAGGIEGGISNGEPIIARAAMKPIPTLYKPLPSVDMITKEPYLAAIERSDTCAAPAASVIGENVVAWIIAVTLMEKFAGDSIEETKRNYASYQTYLKSRM